MPTYQQLKIEKINAIVFTSGKWAVGVGQVGDSREHLLYMLQYCTYYKKHTCFVI